MPRTPGRCDRRPARRARRLLEVALADHQLLADAVRSRHGPGCSSAACCDGRVTAATPDAQLAAAATAFVDLGTPIQAEQARLELASLGGRTASGELTPTELRIAALVGAGRTNSEVASALFLSVRTVESHLGRIYRKLGLRSRTELSRRVTPQPRAESAT